MIILLQNVYYRQDSRISEYKDIYIETNIGFFKSYVTSLEAVDLIPLEEMNRFDRIDDLKRKYGKLVMQEVRRTYDNNLYLLINGKFILAIEYILNSSYEHSIQEIRIIDDVEMANRLELEEFKEMDIVKFP